MTLAAGTGGGMVESPSAWRRGLGFQPSPVVSAEERPQVEYPSGDGEPVAENERQRDAIYLVLGNLRQHFVSREDVHVGGDLLWYYREGDNSASVAPDVFVALGVPRDPPRDSYKVWEEGKTPDFVLEVASPSTAKLDREGKRELYQRLGVREYWMYDPTGGLHRTRLQALRLVGGTYRAVRAERDASGHIRARSKVLGLDLLFDGDRLRIWDPVARRFLPTLAESEARAEAAQQMQREAQAQAVDAKRQRREAQAQAEVEKRQRREAQAQAEVEKRQRREAQAQAEVEKRQRREAQAQAEVEKRHRRDAEARAERERLAREESEALFRADEASYRAQIAELKKRLSN